MNIIGKKRGRKQKIQRSILQSVVFQWYKIQYFFTGTNYLRLKLFVIRTFILFLKIKMYACRTFWLSCFFIKDVDNAAYTVGKTFQRGKRPVLLWQSRLKKMYRSFSRFFSSHATFSHVQACFFTYLHHICMLVASARKVVIIREKIL